jgi:hypothetical protein
MKNIMRNAWAVIITLYNCEFPYNIVFPGYASSNRIIIENAVPTNPDKHPKIIYSVPISLWFVVKNQRLKNEYKRKIE